MRIPRVSSVIAAGVLVPALALVMAACSSSSTSSTKATKPVVTTGTETFTGHLTGTAALAKSPIMPLTWSGPVNTTGTFNLGGPNPKTGQDHAFVTKAGTVHAVITSVPESGNNTPAIINKATCEFRSTTIVDFKVPASAKDTGAFKGATGKDGQVVAVFQGNLPKLKSGKCNKSNNAEPTTDTVLATFTGHVDLTVKG